MANPDTVTIAITFWADGYFDITPDAAISPQFKFGAEPDTVYTDTDQSLVKYMAIGDGYDDVCRTNNNYNLIFHSLTDGVMPAATSGYLMIWYDFQSLLPDDCTILEAKIPVVVAGESAVTYGADEGFIAVLDTLVADASWLSAAAGCGTAWKKASSWLYPDFNDTGTTWSPAMDDRAYLWDFGVVGDLNMNGETVFSAATYDTVMYDVRSLVQHAVTYDSPNYGFLLSSIDGFNQLAPRMGTHASSVGHNPTLYITYTSSPYRGVWSGRDFAFVLQSDDGVDVIEAWSDTTSAHGVKMTHFVDFTNPQGASDATWAAIKDIMAAGHDIQFHSNYDLLGRDGTSSLTHIVSSADDDSLEMALSRMQIFDALGLSLADTLTTMRDFAYPTGTYGAEAIDVMRAQGYRSGRATSSRGNLVNGIKRQEPEWFADGTFATQQSDSARVLSPGRTLNIFALYSRASIGYITGDDINAPCDSIYGNLQRLLDEANRYDKAALFPFAHDRDYEDGRTVGIISEEQMSCVSQWLEDRPWIWTPTWVQLIDFYTREATAVDAPPWAASNHSALTASDKVYYTWEP